MATVTGESIELDIDPADVDRLLAVTPDDVTAASTLTFARNVFIPLTTACRYTCTYCTYFDPPGQASLLTPDEVSAILERGVEAGCTEALFTFGDDPDDRYTSIYAELAELGHDTIHSYLREMCELALDIGLLPHSNPGDQTRSQMEAVRAVNASMGVMLETTADVAAHAGPRRKTPERRIQTIATAGELAIPFTTGILVGIGETWRDRAESLLAIRALHERYGHIQEVIVQNVVPNDRSRFRRPTTQTMRRVTAMARAAIPPEVSIQVPPNLSPTAALLDCGVDDLGGVSPVTDDYINPTYAWPALAELKRLARDADATLIERLPVYERFLDEPPETANRWISDRIRAAMDADTPSGRRYRRVLEDGTHYDPP